MDRMPTTRIACVTTHLLQIAAACEASDPYSSPAEFGHQLRQTPARSSSATALRNFKDVEDQLRGNALDAIVADFTVHAFQREPPGIGILRSQFGPPFVKLL